MSCPVCHIDPEGSVQMDDRHAIQTFARRIASGMVSSVPMNRHRVVGVSLVERCAQIVEKSCGRCRHPDCVRCGIAEDLRNAESALVAERDAEVDKTRIEYACEDLAAMMCRLHKPVGDAIIASVMALKPA